MANVKITELTAETNPVSTDVLPIVDVSADTTKKITIANLLKSAGNGSGASPAFAFDGDSDTGMYRADTNKLGFATAGTGRLFIDANGSIGVGTASPSYLFHVKNASATAASFEVTGKGEFRLVPATDANGHMIRFGGGGAGTAEPRILRFVTSGDVERMRIDNAGNVGIGTSSPGSLLELRKNEATRLRLTRTNAVSNYCQIEAAGTNSEQLTITTDPTGQGSGFIAFENNGSERMRLDSSGNVGIGTNSPVARLHAKVDGTGVDIQKWTADLGVNTRDMVVKSPAADNNDDPFTFQTANSIAFQIDTNEAVRIDAAGRLGVGTNNPASLLHTTGTRDYTGTTPTKSSYDNNFQSGNAYVAIGQSNSIPTIQGHGSGTSFNLALAPNAGNVAIGTTNADAALRVKARINVPPFKVGGPSSEFARIDEFGRLLVGTSVYTSAGDSFSPENLVYVENAGDSGFQTFVGISNRNDENGAAIVLGKTRGTAVGSDTIVQDNDTLGIIKFVGADGNDRSPVGAAIKCQVNGTPGSNDMPGRLVFQTTSDSAASPTTRMMIDSQGALNIFNGTAPTASATNGVKLYAQDVSSSSELKVRDEAGNVTTLSPHNFDLIPEGPSEDMAWSYYSERDGKRINVDMLKAVRLLEQLSGEQLVFTS